MQQKGIGPHERIKSRAARHSTEANCTERHATATDYTKSICPGRPFPLKSRQRWKNAPDSGASAESCQVWPKVSGAGGRCQDRERLIDSEAPAMSEAEGSAP
jgi:hypothetical protein